MPLANFCTRSETEDLKLLTQWARITQKYWITASTAAASNAMSAVTERGPADTRASKRLPTVHQATLRRRHVPKGKAVEHGAVTKQQQRLYAIDVFVKRRWPSISRAMETLY